MVQYILMIPITLPPDVLLTYIFMYIFFSELICHYYFFHVIKIKHFVIDMMYLSHIGGLLSCDMLASLILYALCGCLSSCDILF